MTYQISRRMWHSVFHYTQTFLIWKCLVLFLSRVPHISSCIYTGVATGVIAINHIIYKPNNNT